MSKCKWCDEGVKLVGKDHWIVKSIVPAKITIVKCKAAQPEPIEPFPSVGAHGA